MCSYIKQNQISFLLKRFKHTNNIHILTLVMSSRADDFMSHSYSLPQKEIISQKRI